ncbi:MAG: hypothetical protein LBC98_05040 [Prevotellaceae bacterium]|jgi:hypothetical protein|nr:hypothetical protein [Prevotellaceae bacterium]
MTNKEQLTAYAIKMSRRGDRLRDIANYLDRQGADNQLKSEIITEIEEFAKAEKQAKESQSKSNKTLIWKVIIIIGILLLGLALLLPDSKIMILLYWSIISISIGLYFRVKQIRSKDRTRRERLDENKQRFLKRRLVK